MHTGRASPPLLFGLAPRGVFRAPSVATRAVGSYPTFSPLPNALDRWRRARGFAVGLPQGANHTGGIFSVALSVAATSRFAFAERATQPPGVTRRVALSPRLLRGSGDGSPDFPPASSASALRRIQASRRPSDSPAEIIIKHVRQIDRGNAFGLPMRPWSQETAKPKRDSSPSIGMTKMPTSIESACHGYHATPVGVLL